MSQDQQSTSGEKIPELDSGINNNAVSSKNPDLSDSAWDLEKISPEIEDSSSKKQKNVDKTILEVKPGRKLDKSTKDLEKELADTVLEGKTSNQYEAAGNEEQRTVEKTILESKPGRKLKEALKATGSQIASLVNKAGESVYPRQSQEDEFLGKILDGKYGVKKLVSDDEFGLVYSARDINNGGKVIIRTPKFNTGSVLAAFKNYAQNNLKLKHENIVESVGYFELDNGRPFFASKSNIGITLDELIEEVGGVESAQEFMGIFKSVFDALKYAHENDVLHGGLRPEKIHLEDEDGEVIVKLSGFAYADYKRAVLKELKNFYYVDDLKYLSPEHVKDQELTPASDIFSVGLTIYYVLSGHPAAQLDSSEDYMNAYLSEGIKPKSLAAFVPKLHCVEDMDRIISETLDLDIDWRIKNIDELSEEIGKWLESPAKSSQLTDPDDLSEIPKASNSKGKPRTISNTMHNLVALKRHQVEQEATVIMKFTDIAAKSGKRESPFKTISRLMTTYVGGGLFILLVATYSILNWDHITNFYLNQSKVLFGVLGKKEAIEEVNDELPPVEGGPLPEIKTKDEANTTATANNTTNNQSTNNSTQTHTFNRKRKFKYSESPSYMQFIPKDKGSKKEIIDPSQTDRFVNDKKYFEDGKIW